MDLLKGVDVNTVEEAEGFIKEFIQELRNDESGRMRRHSREYDLFLPWLWEEITNSGTHDNPAHTRLETNELYMEAAWSLVQQGYLRPGPPKITSEDSGGDYGKGYTLTFKGKEWIGDTKTEGPAAKEVGETEPDLDASPV